MASAENTSLEYLRSLGIRTSKSQIHLSDDCFSIGNYDIDSILYDETLICSLPNNTDVGSFEVKLSKTNYGELRDCIQVIANRFVRFFFKHTMKIIMSIVISQATIDDVLCGTTVRAVVTRELVTVQQEHTEYVKVGLFEYQVE